MSVSSTFFHAIQTHSSISEQLPWKPHPLSWKCLNNNVSDSCLNSISLVNFFFSHLLKPLETQFGNCTKAPAKLFHWTCPSHTNAKDFLTLDIRPTYLSFQSDSKGFGECRSPLPFSSSPKFHPNNLTCTTTTSDQSLLFTAHGDGLSEIKERDEHSNLRMIFMQWTDYQDSVRSFDGDLFNESHIKQFLNQSERSKDYLQTPHGLLKIFVDAKEQKEGNDVSYCQQTPFSTEHLRNSLKQGHQPSYGLLSTILGTLAATAYFFLSKRVNTQENKQPLTQDPNQKRDNQAKTATGQETVACKGESAAPSTASQPL